MILIVILVLSVIYYITLAHVFHTAKKEQAKILSEYAKECDYYYQSMISQRLQSIADWAKSDQRTKQDLIDVLEEISGDTAGNAAMVAVKDVLSK